MTKTKKIIIGVLTVLPIFFFIMYFVSIFSMMGEFSQIEQGGGPQNPEEAIQSFASIFAYIGIAILLLLGLLIFYIIDIVNNPKFKSDTSNNKLIWILVVLFGGIIGMIVYFFVEIYPRPELPPLPPNQV